MLSFLASILSSSGEIDLGQLPWRALLAAASSLILSLLLGWTWIRCLGKHCREPQRSDSARLNELHQAKAATPTMGGAFLVTSFIVALLLFGDLSSVNLWHVLLLTLGLALLGAWDDWVKLRTHRRGMSAKAKLAGQTLLAALIVMSLYWQPLQAGSLSPLAIPLSGAELPLGWMFVPLAVLVIVGSSNAVNLTDGLDGLAAGCVLAATAGLGLTAYGIGEANGNMLIVLAALAGAVAGFLWFNRYPARVFMGNTGSLPLGGLLGLVAVILGLELLFALIGGIFVIETLSVVLQVGSYKLRRKRIFLCAPLHHHFQFLGWPEQAIVRRFWIAAVLCAMAGVASSSVVSSRGQQITTETRRHGEGRFIR